MCVMGIFDCLKFLVQFHQMGLQVCGLDIDKNAIQRIECGKRFVTDIELVQLANVLRVEISRLVQ